MFLRFFLFFCVHFLHFLLLIILVINNTPQKTYRVQYTDSWNRFHSLGSNDFVNEYRLEKVIRAKMADTLPPSKSCRNVAIIFIERESVVYWYSI
jgi:hypothetical protein